MLLNVSKCQRESYEKENWYCFVGRLSHEKGVKTLIEAANQLPYKLIVIGDGPLRSELELLSKSNIEFVGQKQWDDLKGFVGKARFSVIPSEWNEVFGLVIIESQCLGTPVLGAKIGGIPELIKDKQEGMLFESGNVDDLKNKIEVMFNQSFDYETLAKRAQTKFCAGKYYEQLIQIYGL